MGFFSSVLEKAGRAVTEVADRTVLLREFDLPNNWGTVKVYPVAYRVYLRPGAVEELKRAENFAGAVTGVVAAVTAGSGGTLAPVAGALAAFMTLQWAAIQLAANDDGVTLRGQYLPPTGLLVPTPGES
ncbi:MAG: hypothetical protein JNL98_14105 [Bryobacterales bacterium]|nr:hypothetical protein [Bryobacterales bacterium]